MKKPATEDKDHQLLIELHNHYKMWTEDNDKRLKRKNGWNNVTDAYYGNLPDDWPYNTKIVDPRIRTSLIEKNARLINGKLRGRLIPRDETGTVIKARINNSVLDLQWDAAQDGGSMNEKLSVSDLDTRLYGSKFGLVTWLRKEEEKEVVFEGNEYIPLDIRDCGLEPIASNIKNAKWFQLRTWEYIEDLETQLGVDGKPLFKNLGELKSRLKKDATKKSKYKSSTRTEYTPRTLQLRSLVDRMGEDLTYPVVKLVTEYRRDRWITFSPDYKLIVRDISNPYEHKKIPFVQLKYYSAQDDPLGESEVEGVLPLWKAIQATICAYMDEVILKMRPPLKVIENAARVETIEYGPEVQWLVDRQDAIEEMRSSGDSLRYFETTYSALVAAFNTAMGDLSQGVSSFDMFTKEKKTATEIRASTKQQNVRDQKNQNTLAEFIQDIMMLWLSNNRQFLFSNPEKKHLLLRIVGQDNYQALQSLGLSDTETPPENIKTIADAIEQNPDMSDLEVQNMVEAASVPLHPVMLNPDEKNPAKLKVVPKLKMGENEQSADLYLTPDDLEGLYSYVPDVKSMAIGAGEERSKSRQDLLQLLTTNGNLLQLLQQEGFRPKVKELLTSVFEGLGLKDADRYFEGIQNELQNEQAQAGAPQVAGALQPLQKQGLPTVPQANPAGGVQQPVARSV